MMNLDNVTMKLAAEGINAEPITVVKNGVECNGLRITTAEDSNITPVVYCLAGDTEGEYLARIRSVVNMPKPSIDVDMLTDRDYIQEHVFLAVQKQSNDTSLVKRPLLNLELFMRIHVDDLFAEECGTVKVNQSLLDASGMTADEVWDAAFVNTRNALYSPSLDVLLDLPEELCNEVPFVVVTTSYRRDGAAFLAIESAFQDLCRKLEVESLYVLPSSTEELLCLPIREDDMDPMELARMVADVNDIVEETIRLDPVSYRYDLDSNRIRIAASLM